MHLNHHHKLQVVRQRLPDPPPDVIDRVVVVPQPKKFVYQVVEVPTKPPPVIQERFVPGAPKPPVCAGTYRVQVPPKATNGHATNGHASNGYGPTGMARQLRDPHQLTNNYHLINKHHLLILIKHHSFLFNSSC